MSGWNRSVQASLIVGIALLLTGQVAWGAMESTRGGDAHRSAQIERGRVLWSEAWSGHSVGRGFGAAPGAHGWASRRAPLVLSSCHSCHARVVGGEVVVGLPNLSQDLRGVVAAVIRAVRGLALRDRISLARPGRVVGLRALWARWRRILNQIGSDCDGAGPGVFPSVRFWLAIGDQQGRDLSGTPCGLTKIPHLFEMGARKAMFVGAEVIADTPLVAPGNDLLGAAGGPRWAAFVSGTEEGQALSAYVKHGLKSPPWERYAATPIARDKALRGAEIFHRPQGCASCHGRYDGAGALVSYTQRLVPLEVIGTDPQRAEVVTPAMLNSYSGLRGVRVPLIEGSLGPAGPWRGYLASPLCSPALNAPFLHTGSVANLVELLKPPHRRAQQFWVGDFVDESVGGYPTREMVANALAREGETPQAVRPLTRMLSGHAGPRFGTGLNPSEQEALVTYVKTLHCP